MKYVLPQCTPKKNEAAFYKIGLVQMYKQFDEHELPAVAS